MSKRVTIRDNKRKTQAKVFPHSYKKRGKERFGFIVRWVEDGKKKRKQFTNQEDASNFADAKNINLKSESAERQLVNTKLTEDQAQQAERAFEKLSDTYTLDKVIEYFLENHRPPDFSISILDGLKVYLDEKERETVQEKELSKA